MGNDDKKDRLILPFSNSRKKVRYEVRFRESGLKYHNILDDDFIFATYDLPLPAVQKEYLDWIEGDYDFDVSARSKDMSDGFKSAKAD